MSSNKFLSDNNFLNEKGDKIDIACNQEFIARYNAMQMRKPVIKANGFCFNCENPVEGLFCNLSCSEDWQKRQNAEKINGR